MKNLAKTKLVAEITDSIGSGKNFVFVKFERTSHKTLEELRRDLRKNESTLRVLKNTIAEKAVNILSTKDPFFSKLKKRFFPLKETSALLSLNGEWNPALSAFYGFIDKEKSLSFKFGVLDGEMYETSEMVRIAQLPNRNQMIAKLVGQMKNPMSKIVYGMKFNTQKFVYILKESSKKAR